MRLNLTKVYYQHFTISELGITRQGSNQLYKGLGKSIHKGHLNPVYINSYDANEIAGTFTYANAVPQYAGFNMGKWKTFEMKIADYARDKCAPSGGDMYVLTGTSQFHISQFKQKTKPRVKYLKKEIEIPNSMWTAFCCVIGPLKAYALAFIGNNVKNINQINMQQISVGDLEKFLSLNNQQVTLFPANSNLCR